MKKKQVQLPFNMQSEFLSYTLATKAGVIISNWAAQGVRYMNKYERLYRITFETLVIVLFSLILAQILGVYVAIGVSLFIVHTIFWLFNGHFYVLMRYVRENKIDPTVFFEYVDAIHERVQTKNFLLAAVAFGSLSRDSFSETSDFDVRFIRRKGFVNSIRAFNCCSLERARAFLNGFPLDIYVFDLDEIDTKIRPDEPPIIMFDPDGAVSDKFGKNSSQFKELRRKVCEVAPQ